MLLQISLATSHWPRGTAAPPPGAHTEWEVSNSQGAKHQARQLGECHSTPRNTHTFHPAEQQQMIPGNSSLDTNKHCPGLSTTFCALLFCKPACHYWSSGATTQLKTRKRWKHEQKDPHRVSHSSHDLLQSGHLPFQRFLPCKHQKKLILRENVNFVHWL